MSNSGWSDDPQIISQIMTSGNNVYVVWIDSITIQNVDTDIYFKRSTDNGTSFNSGSINLSNNAGMSKDPKIAPVVS